MPTSNLNIAAGVVQQLWESRKQIAELLEAEGRRFEVLDVGPGRGKYGYLTKEYVDPEAHVTALEVHEPYITEFGLTHIYDEVIPGDVLDAGTGWLNSFDAILLIDVIEHLPKPEALELLSRVTEATITIATPTEFFHNPPELPESEKHRSHWTLADFEATGRIETFAQEEYQTLGCILVRLGRV